MTMKVSGVVKGVYSKPVTTKFGNKNVYDMLLDDGNYYKHGFKKPNVEVGDSVTIEYEVDKYGNKILKLSSGATGSSAPTDNQGTAAPSTHSTQTYSIKNSKPFPVPFDHGDRSIIRQNSLTNARELVDAIWQNYGVGDESPIDEDVIDRILKIAYKFEEYSSGDREAKAADAILNKGKTTAPKKVKAIKSISEEEDSVNN